MVVEVKHRGGCDLLPLLDDSVHLVDLLLLYTLCLLEIGGLAIIYIGNINHHISQINILLCDLHDVRTHRGLLSGHTSLNWSPYHLAGLPYVLMDDLIHEHLITLSVLPVEQVIVRAANHQLEAGQVFLSQKLLETAPAHILVSYLAEFI